MAPEEALDGRLLELVRAKDELDALVRGFRGDDAGATTPLSVRLPKLIPPELGFIQTVSWLYAFFHEVAKVDIVFLSEKFDAYELDVSREGRDHRSHLGRLRTYLQHNLNFTRGRDRETERSCKSWFRDACGTSVPNTDAEWRSCLAKLLLEAISFLAYLIEAIRRIERDEAHAQIREDWIRRVDRQHGPEEFDTLISITANDMGRESLDVVRLRQRFFEKWMAALRLLADGYDFQREARRLIEYAILSEPAAGLPITGVDVIEALGIPPGPEVGRLLERAKRLYEESPVSAEELLDRLRVDDHAR